MVVNTLEQSRPQQTAKPQSGPKPLIATPMSPDNTMTSGATGGHDGSIFPETGIVKSETGTVTSRTDTAKLSAKQSLLGTQGEITPSQDDGTRASDPKTQTAPLSQASENQYSTARKLTTTFTHATPHNDDPAKWDG